MAGQTIAVEGNDDAAAAVAVVVLVKGEGMGRRSREWLRE